MTAPRAAFQSGLLLSGDRIARAGLREWAERLSASLSSVIHGTRAVHGFASQVAGVANNAALVAALQGRAELAWTLSEEHVRWQLRLSRRSREPSVAGHAVQPWVNLGRLEGLSGQWEAAVSRFTALLSHTGTGRLRLGTACISLSDTPAGAANREAFDHFLLTVYVVDSLKALLQSHRYDETLDFAASLPASLPPVLALSSDEARVIAACGLRSFEDALRGADTAARGVRGWPRAVFRLRMAEAYACAGSLSDATAVLASLARVVRQISPERKRETGTLQVTSRIASACRELGLGDQAWAIAHDVYDGAREAGDEVFRIESLRILAATAPAGERSRWEEELAQAEETTEYARYRRGGSPPPNPVIEGLYQQLEEVFSN